MTSHSPLALAEYTSWLPFLELPRWLAMDRGSVLFISRSMEFNNQHRNTYIPLHSVPRLFFVGEHGYLTLGSWVWLGSSQTSLTVINLGSSVQAIDMLTVLVCIQSCGRIAVNQHDCVLACVWDSLTGLGSTIRLLHFQPVWRNSVSCIDSSLVGGQMFLGLTDQNACLLHSFWLWIKDKMALALCGTNWLWVECAHTHIHTHTQRRQICFRKAGWVTKLWDWCQAVPTKRHLFFPLPHVWKGWAGQGKEKDCLTTFLLILELIWYLIMHPWL